MSLREKRIWLLGVFLLLVTSCSPSSKSETSIEIHADLGNGLTAGSTVDIAFTVDTVPGAPFTIIALPDTQYYSQKYPHIFLAQTQWIADHHEELNLAFVTHLGDIVQHDDQFEHQWETADAAMGMLDGLVPYGVLPGNHDMGRDGTAQLYQAYFPPSRFENYEWWGGSFNGNKNNYQLFSAGMDDFLILHLQFCTTDEAILWAQEVLNSYPERRVIISTHAYIETHGYRTPNCKKNSDGTNSAIDLWQKLVAPYDSVELVLSGHIPGVGQRTDTIDSRTIHQLLADYQGMAEGGGGYLRIMRFFPLEDVFRVETYSPYLDAYLTDEANQFELPFELADAGQVVGEVTISAGEASCTATVDQGSCTLTLSESAVEAIVAEYAGHGSYAPSRTVLNLNTAGE